MKKNLYLFLILLISWAGVKAQDPVKRAIERTFFVHLPNRGAELMKTEPYKNKAFIFGIAIGVNKLGLVDTVMFSNQTKELDSIFNFAKVALALKNNKIAFRNEKNSLLVTNVFIRREWDDQIDNVKAFNEYFNNLLPELGDLLNTRKIKLIKSINMTQVKGHE